MARSTQAKLIGEKIKKQINDTFINAVSSIDTSKATAQGLGSLSKKVGEELQKQLDDLDRRLTSLENGGSFKNLGSDLERISVDFINKFTDSLSKLTKEGLQGVTIDLEPLKAQMSSYFKEAFANFGQFKFHQIDKNEAINMIKQNQYFPKLEKWSEDGTSANFKNRENFDKELIRNLELRNASLNATYYKLLETYADELEGLQLQFEEFLNMSPDFFRGASTSQKYDKGRLVSFTPLRDIAEGFAQNKGDALYSAKLKMKDTLGAPGVVLDEMGEELEILIQVDNLLDDKNRLPESMIVARNDGKSTGLQEIQRKEQSVEFMSQEYIQNLKKTQDERIQAEQKQNRKEEQIRSEYLQKEQSNLSDRLKTQQELDRKLFESERFKEAEQQYPWLNKIVEREKIDEDVFNFNNLTSEDINNLNKLYDEREDLEFDFTGDNSAFITLKSLNDLLDEVEANAKETKTAVNSALNSDLASVKQETHNESQNKTANLSAEDNIQSQEDLKQAVDQTNVSIENQKELTSSPPSSKVETNIQDQKDFKQAVDTTTISLKQQEEVVTSSLPSSVDSQIEDQKELKQAVETTKKAEEQSDVDFAHELNLQDTIQKVKELESSLKSLDVEKISKVSEQPVTNNVTRGDLNTAPKSNSTKSKNTNTVPETEEEKLENLIKLLKEYYTLQNKAFGTTGNVKSAYDVELSRLASLIEKYTPELRAQAHSDIRVSLPKAKYDDALAEQSRKEQAAAEKAKQEAVKAQQEAEKAEQQRTQKRIEETKDLYQEYLKVMQEVNLMQAQADFVTDTEQENKALEENLRKQQDVAQAIRAKIEAQREWLGMSDADISNGLHSVKVTDQQKKDLFDATYRGSLEEYEKAFEKYYAGYHKLLTAREKNRGDTTILKLTEQVKGLAEQLDTAKKKLDTLTKYAGNNSIDLGNDRKQVDNLIEAYKTQDSQAFNRQYTELSGLSSEKIEKYNQELSRLHSLITSLHSVEIDPDLGFETASKEAANLKKQISSLIKDLGSNKYQKVTKSGTWLGEANNKDILSSVESVKRLVRSYSELNSSMSSIKNVSLGKDFKTANVEILTQDGNLRKLKLTYDEAENSLRSLVMSEQHYVTVSEKFSQALDNKIMQMGAYAATAVSMYEVIDVAKQGAQYVTEFDSALAELQLASNASDEFLQNITVDIQNLANSLASTNTEVAQSTTEWVKLGYTAQDSLDLASASATYARVGFTDVDTATTNLTSTIQAFKDSMAVGQDIGDFAEDIVDKFVNVGNTFASTAEGLGTALTDSAQALVTAGNSLDEALALITAGNTITQDEPSVGAGLRTVSMRLRGTKASALIDAGEDTDGLIEDAAKLYNTIKELTKTTSTPEGISILTDTGDFKSTYKILLDIAYIWDEINDKSRAALLETIAGKNRANIVASILQTKDENGDPLLKSAYEASLVSDGAAAEAMAITLDTVESSFNRMQNAWQTLFQNSDMERWLTMVYNLATGFLNIADSINLVEGSLGLLGGTIVGLKLAPQFKELVSSIREAHAETNSWITAIKTSFSGGSSLLNSLKGLGGTLFSSLAGGIIGFGISQLINVAILGIDDLIHAQERAIEQAEDLKKSYQETTNTIASELNTLSSYRSRFEELSAGVGSNGENVSLSTEEYQEYKDIVSGIIEIQPSLARGYDEENGYLVDKNTLLEEAIRLQKEQKLVEAQEYGSRDNVQTLYEGAKAEYDKAMDEYDSGRFDFAQSIYSILEQNMTGDYSDLSKVFTDFFNFDTKGYDTTWLLMDNYEVVVDRFKELVSELVSSSVIGESAANEMFAAWRIATQNQMPEMSTEPVKATIASALSSYVSEGGDEEISTFVNNFADLFASAFSDLDFSNQTIYANFMAFWLDLANMAANDPAIKEAMQRIVSLDVSDLTPAEAENAYAQYGQTIIDALPEGENSDILSSMLTGDALMKSAGYDDLAQKVAERNQEITDGNIEALQKLNTTTIGMSIGEMQVWLDKTEGAKSYEEAIRNQTKALQEQQLVETDFIQSNSEAYNAYAGSLSSAEDYLGKFADGTLTIEDVTLGVTDLGLDSSKINFDGDWAKDFVNLLSEDVESAWDVFVTSLGEIGDPNMQAWINALEQMKDKALSASEANSELSSSLGKMSSLSSSMESIKSAYDSLATGEAISMDSFATLAESFGDLPSFDNFVDSVAGLSSVTDEAQEAFNQLAIEAIYNSEVMDQIIAQNGEYTETQKALLVAMLDEVGVVNSEAVAMSILGQNVADLQAKKLMLQIATLDFASASQSTIDAIFNEIGALIQEGIITEDTANKILAFGQAKLIANGRVINCDGDIIALQNVANAAIQAHNAIASVKDSEIMWTESAGGNTAADNHRKNIEQKRIDTLLGGSSQKLEELDFSDLLGTTANYGGSGISGSGGGGGGAEAAANEIDWISRRIELLEEQISKLADKAADAYAPWIDRSEALADSIDATIELASIQQDAYEEYMSKAEAVGLPDEYKKLIQEGGDFVEELNDESLNKAIEEYKKYYDQAQDCKDQVDELIHSVKELNSQKLDNLADQYDSAQEGMESMIAVLEWQEQETGKDYSEEIADLEKERLEMAQQAPRDMWEQWVDNYNTGAYGAEKGTVMVGNVAVKAVEELSAFGQAMEKLGFSAGQAAINLSAATAELYNTDGEGTGVYVTFNPVLPDGRILDANTWRQYLQSISQNGTITSATDLMAADQQGAVINGQQISNILMTVMNQLPSMLRGVLTNGSVNTIQYGNSLATAQQGVSDYLRNNVFTDSFLDSYGVEGMDINEVIDELVSEYFDNANFSDVSDVKKAFDNDLEDALLEIISEFVAIATKALSQGAGEYEKLPEYAKESAGYNEAAVTDLTKVANSAEEASEITADTVDEIQKKYEHQLTMLGLQYEGATIENKGLVGGGVSLNEQVGILESQLSVQEKIRQDILRLIMATSDPDSEEYKYAQEALQQIQNDMDETAAKIVEAILDDFNRVVEAYENALGLLEHRATMINLNMELADAQGYMASGVWYEYLIKNSEEELALLQQEREVLQEKLDAAVGSGYVEQYSEAWYEMQNQINQVDEAILQTTIDIQEFKNEIRQIEWDRFDFMQEKINTLNDEYKFLIQLIENSQELIDDYGNFTDWGWTSISLYQQQFETYAELVKNYRQEIADLDADFESDPLNKDYIERRQELLEQEREYILSQQEARNAILDLVQDAYDQQLDKLQEIIDKKKESLQAEKDLYDYQKKVSDQTKNIADIQKQLSAYAGDDSEEAQKTIQELKVDLADAMSDLQDTEYDKYISDQEEMMDRLYSDYEEWIDMRMDDPEAVLEDILAQVDEKGSVIEDCLTEITGTWNYDRLMETIDSIKETVQAMFDRADANAALKSEEVWNNTVTQPLDTIYNGETIGSIIGSVSGGGSGGGGFGGGSFGSGSGSKKPSTSSGPSGPLYENGHTSPSLFAPIYQNNSGDDYSTYGPGSAEYDQMLSQLFNDGYSLEDSREEFGDTDWFQYAEDFKHKNSYKEGGTLGKLVKYTGEDGIFFGRLGEEIVTPEELDKLSAIFEQVDLLSNLKGKYATPPASVIQQSTNMGDVKFEVTLPNVHNYEDFRRQLIRDPNFEKATLTMVNNAVVGKSSLAKLKYL